MAQILLVGQDRDRAAGLRSLLYKDGHRVTWLRAGREWSAAEHDARPELIVAAVDHPSEVFAGGGSPTRGFPAPLLCIENEGGLPWEASMHDRLVDRLQSPFMAEEFLARVDALVTVRRVARREPAGGAGGSSAPGVRGIGGRVRSLLFRRVPSYPKPAAPYVEVAARVAEFADRRDNFEPGHAGRVASFCAMMADGLDLPDHEVEVLLRAAMLHDIGKVTVPVEVLMHRGPLDEGRMRLVRTHAERGAALLRALEPDDEIARVVLYHHERPDGSGYFGKCLDGVPRASRLLAVAEAYDAMTAARWHEPVPVPQAIGILRDKRGGQFDPDAVDALVDALTPRPTRISISRR